MFIHSSEKLPFHSCQHSYNRTKTTFHSLFLTLVWIRGRPIELLNWKWLSSMRPVFFCTIIETCMFWTS